MRGKKITKKREERNEKTEESENREQREERGNANYCDKLGLSMVASCTGRLISKN